MINSFAAHWLDQLDRMARESDKKTYLLIDGVFLDDAPSFIRQWPVPIEPQCALFYERSNANAAVLAASPWLLPYLSEPNQIDRLLAQCDALPAVICIRSHDDTPTLLSRLKRWTIVSCGDMQFNFRFTDTRRLPAIHRTLTLKQKVKLFGEHDKWTFVNRRGQWEHLEPLDENVSQTIAKSQWEELRIPELNDDQFAVLLNDSEPDEIVAAIWAELPEGCVTRTTSSPADIYDYAQLALKHAARAGWVATPDRMTICRWLLEQDALERLTLLQDIERRTPDQTVEDALQNLEAASYMASRYA